MAKCITCEKTIKGTRVVIDGTAITANMCARCLFPFTKLMPEGEKRRLVQLVYKNITRHKKR